MGAEVPVNQGGDKSKHSREGNRSSGRPPGETCGKDQAGSGAEQREP